MTLDISQPQQGVPLRCEFNSVCRNDASVFFTVAVSGTCGTEAGEFLCSHHARLRMGIKSLPVIEGIELRMSYLQKLIDKWERDADDHSERITLHRNEAENGKRRVIILRGQYGIMHAASVAIRSTKQAGPAHTPEALLQDKESGLWYIRCSCGWGSPKYLSVSSVGADFDAHAKEGE